MDKKTDKSYAPSMRNYLDDPLDNKISFSKDGNSYSLLPDNVKDDIIVNNISSVEFDYTYDNPNNEQF